MSGPIVVPIITNIGNKLDYRCSLINCLKNNRFLKYRKEVGIRDDKTFTLTVFFKLTTMDDFNIEIQRLENLLRRENAASSKSC